MPGAFAFGCGIGLGGTPPSRFGEYPPGGLCVFCSRRAAQRSTQAQAAGALCDFRNAGACGRTVSRWSSCKLTDPCYRSRAHRWCWVASPLARGPASTRRRFSSYSGSISGFPLRPPLMRTAAPQAAVVNVDDPSSKADRPEDLLHSPSLSRAGRADQCGRDRRVPPGSRSHHDCQATVDLTHRE